MTKDEEIAALRKELADMTTERDALVSVKIALVAKIEMLDLCRGSDTPKYRLS